MQLDLLSLSEFLANVATFLGIPLALLVFWRERRRDREERELATYGAMNDKYTEYLRFCLENPDLGVYDPRQTPERVDESVTERKFIAFEILVCLLEQAFFLYRDHADPFKTAQWTGWNDYMSNWLARPDFRNAWKSELGFQFDSDFCKHMNYLLAAVEAKSSNTQRGSRPSSP